VIEVAALVLLAQLHCAPNAMGTVDCYDAPKGGAPVLKVEPKSRNNSVSML